MSPFAPRHPCGFPGYPVLVESGRRRCEKHRIQESKELDRKRGSASHRGYGARWCAARKQFLAVHPLCAECRRQGHVKAATVVDHTIPHKGNANLFWDESNWQGLCKQCHDRKTGEADGRWIWLRALVRIWGGGAEISKTICPGPGARSCARIAKINQGGVDGREC
jgi:5-methylcytosine-specific restriction protein A